MKISDVLKKWTPEEEEEETSVKRTGVSSANNSGNVKSKMKVSDVTDKWNRSYTVATDKHRKPEELKTKWKYTFTQPENARVNAMPEPEARSQTGVGGMAQGFYWGDNWTGDGSGRTWSALGDREMMTDKQRALADRLAEYNTLSTRPDFKKYSAYDPSLVNDPLYGAVNGDRQAQIALQKDDPEGLRAMIGTDKSFARQMNPYELSRYNYIRTTRGAEAADQYLEDIRSDLQSRQMDKRLSKAEAFADEHPIGAQLLSYAMPSELGIYGAVGDWAKGEKLDPNAGYRTWSRMQTALRSADSSAVEREVSLHFGEAAGKLAGKGYNLLTSYSDSRINQLMFPGMEVVPLLRMGAQAASHALDEAQARGLNDNRALALSLIAGAAEVATEQYSLESLLNADPVNEGMIRTLLKQMAAEGSEEMASEAINAVADYMISGNKAEARQSYYKHINEDHMSPEKARLAVCAEIAGQIVESGIGGALMGGLGGVTIAGMSELGAYQTGRDLHTMTQSYEVPGSRFQHAADWGDVQRGVITAAQQQPVGTRAKTLGDQARAKIDAGGQLSDLEFGRLYTALDAQQQALQERTDERVREKLQQQGEDIERQTQDTLLDLARDKVAEETGVDMTQAVEEAPAESRQNEARAAETAQEETTRTEKETGRSEARSEAAEAENETEFVELGGEENEAAFAELQGEKETRAEAPQTRTQERTSPSLRTMNTRMTEAYKEAFDPAQLEKVKSAFGEAGQKALTDNYKGEQMTAPYVRGFMAFYNAGLTGTRASDVSLGARTLISTDTAVRAWAAGRQDAQAKNAQLTAQKGSVAVVQNPGVDYSDAKTSEWAAKNGVTARRVNQLTQALGMSMTVEDIIRVGKTGEANAQLLNARLTLSNNAEKRTATYRGENISNPVMWTIGHEVGHRLRELAPEAFDALAKTMPQEAVRDIEWQQYAYAQAGVDEKFESAAEEAAANYVADLLEGGQVLDEFIDRQTRAGNRNVLQKLGDMIRNVYRDVKAYLSGDEARAIRQSIRKLEAALDAAAEQAKKNARNGVTAEAREAKKNAAQGGGKYSTKNEVLALPGVDWMSNNSSIKEQLRTHAGEINQMEPVAVVVYNHNLREDLVDIMMSQLPKMGGGYIRNSGVDFVFDLPGAKRINGHATGAEMRAAAMAAPYVAKYGKLIAGQKNHENTGLTTLTFAAPVIINEQPVNVGVVIQFQNNGSPRAVNVGLQGGEKFVINTKKALRGTDSRVDRFGQGTSLPTRNASKDNVPHPDESVKSEGKFSLQMPVEETKDLLALHNLTADKLSKALSLGGFPMPSIAVTRDSIPHTNFGDITLVMNKSTVDPKADRRNTVYSADAWTPTFPSIEYEADPKAESRLRRRYYEMLNKFGDEATRPLYPWGNYAEDQLNRSGGVDGVIERAMDDTDMMKLFLMDRGLDVPGPVTEESVTRIDDGTRQFYDHFINALGKDVFAELSTAGGKNPVEVRREWWGKHGEAFETAYKDYMTKLGFSEEEIGNVLEHETVAAQTRKALEMRNYIKNGPETRKTTTNIPKTQDAIRAAVDQAAYSEWLHELFDGLEKSRGIYNGRDRYTSSGNQRSFKATHYEVTLENIAKAMAAENNGNSRNVSGFHGVKSLRAGMAERFSSIAQMHEREGRLQHLTQEQADQINDALAERLNDILGRIYDSGTHGSSDNSFIERDNIGETLMEVTEQRSITPETIKRVFKKYRYNLDNALAEDVRELLFDVSQMPVNIFEAKPERAVRFDEVLAAIVPTGTDPKLIQQLRDAGVQNITEYEKDNDAERVEKVNQVEGAKFSLKQRNDAYAAAVERGDMDEAQRMVDEAAKAAGYDTPKLYHGTRAFGFTEFDASKSDDGISFFATDSPMTARTYSGETDRNRIKDAARINVDNLRGEALLEEAKKQPRLQRYKDYRLMSGEERQRLIEEERRGITLTAQDAADFINDHEGAFDADKMAVMDRLLNALSDVSTARDEDSLQEAWDRWSDAMWDLKWMDESIQMEFIDAIGNRQLQVMKNHLDDFMYNGDIFIEDDEYSFSYVFDNQVALELDTELHKGVYELYGKTGNQLVIDANGSNWNQITAPDELNLYGPQRTRDIAVAAKANGYDSVLFKNMRDNGGETTYNGESNVYIFFNASDLKSADPVTYDDDGNVIPLSERFNQKRDDIRYSIKRDFSNVTPATRQESMDLDATDDRNVARYQNEVTQVLDGTMRTNQLVLLGRPSDILQKYLGSDKPLYVPQSAVKKAALPKESGGKHGLGRVVVDEMPYQFADPLAITGNTTEHMKKGDNSIVVWTNWETGAGDSIIVPIRIDVKGSVGVYNNVNTAFDAYNPAYVADLLREDNVLYTRDNKSIRELLTQRRQVPKWEQANASGESVPQDKGNVNYSLKGTETQREIAELREQVDRLRTNVERWKNETKRSDRQAVDPKVVERTARALAKEYTGSAKGADITKELESLYNFISHGGDGKDELTFESAFDRALAIADTLIENAVTQDDEAYREYEALRRYCRETPFVLGPEDAANITDYSSWAKGNRGRLRVKRGDRTNVDSYYQELAQEWPEFFDPDITDPADQIMRVRDVLDGLYTVNEYNPFSEHMEDAKLYAANDIMDRFWDVPNVKKTFADRAHDKLVRERIKWSERADRRVAKAVEIRDARIERLKDHYKTRIADNYAKQSAAKLRGMIERHAKALSAKLLRPTDKQHVPEELREPVAKVLASINLGSAKLRNGEVTKRTQAFAELKKAYSQIAGQIVIDPELIGLDGQQGLLDQVIAMSDTPIAAMNKEQLQVVWQALRAVEGSVQTANKNFRIGRAATIEEVANGLREDNKGKVPPREWQIGGKLQKLTGLDMMTPEAYFHRLGATGEAVFRALRDAQDRFTVLVNETAEATKSVLGSYDTNKAERQTVTVRLGQEDVQLTRAQLMELYVLMRREQAQQHVLLGGLLPEAIKGPRNTKIVRAEPVRGITLDQCVEAFKQLTDEEIRIAEGLQRYLSEDMSDRGNEASMEVYGYKKFGEKNYWPLRTNKQETKSTVEKDTQITSVAGKGFTKATIPNADNSVQLGSIFDTYSKHVAEMSTYAAYLAATEDVNRLRNWQFREENTGRRTGSTKGILDRVFGQGGSAYLSKLLSDVAVGVSGNTVGTEYAGTMTGAFKSAAIGANIRVIMQQPTAILRAGEMIDARYLAKGQLHPFKGWERAVKYAPIAQWKDWGYFDIGTGRSMKNVILDADHGLEKMKNKLSEPAGKADSFAWGILWNAVEAEMKDRNKDLKPGTNEFYEACAKRFTEIVDHTQVVDGVLQRAQIMRSSDGLVKMATSFMSEPTKQWNQFWTAVYDVKHASGDDRKKAKQQMVRAIIALLASFAANAAAQSLIDAMRDSDRDKKYWERFMEAYTGFEGFEEGKSKAGSLGKAIINGNFSSNLLPFEYVPFIKDASSIMQGYDVSRTDMSVVSDTWRATQNAWKALNGQGKMTVGNAITSMGLQAAKLAGIPFANLQRDALALLNTVAVETDSYLMEYYYDRALYGINLSSNNSRYYDTLYRAYVNDQEQFEILYDELLKNGFEAEKIKSNMESRMKKTEGVNSVKDLSHRFVAPK